MKNTTHQSGISLVEVLVALVISLFLLGGIVQVYIANKTTYKFTNALSEVQENGRFALDTITRDIRQIGHWGCISFDPTNTSNIVDQMTGWASYDTDLHDFLNEDAIEGSENDVNGSDTLTIRGSKPGQANITNPFAETTDRTIRLNSTNNIADNDILLIMHCGATELLIDEEADIVRVTSVDTPGPGQFDISYSTDLSRKYRNDATVIELQTVTYSIQPGENGDLALFRSEFGVDEELIEGVERMEILYGVATGTESYANQYLTSALIRAAGGPDFGNVVSARIMLLVASSDAFVNEAPQKYDFNSADDITAADRRFYQVFTSTIALRNRAGF
jgi:type IV pilus assembly protein PilW